MSPKRWPQVSTRRLTTALSLATALLVGLVVVMLAAAYLTHSAWAGVLLLGSWLLVRLLDLGDALETELTNRFSEKR